MLQLPDRGNLFICTDLQGNLKDFLAMLQHFEAAGPEAWLVLTGDLVHGPNEATVSDWPDFLGTPYRDASPALIDAFVAAQQRHPGRVWCLLGNHDHAHIGGPTTSKFHADERAHLELSLGPVGRQRLRSLIAEFPLVAVAQRCGAVLLHAAPAARLSSARELETLSLEGFTAMHFSQFIAAAQILGPLLWARSAPKECSAQFVAALGGTFAVFGHDVVREGYVRHHADQLCVSTSFGLVDAVKTYVRLDLAAHYGDARALREGHELLKLYP